MAEGFKIIFGLGNPGKQYQNTRHNAGYMALATLAQLKNFSDPIRSGRSLVTKGKIEGQKVILAWPQTYMNNSGHAVKDLLNFYKLPSSNILVIHDDMDINVGRLKASSGGGSGGHNGLISIANELSGDFDRLRVGIGRPDKGIFGGDYAPYVLSSFSPGELDDLDRSLLLAAECAVIWLNKGMSACQRKANAKPKTPKAQKTTPTDGQESSTQKAPEVTNSQTTAPVTESAPLTGHVATPETESAPSEGQVTTPATECAAGPGQTEGPATESQPSQSAPEAGQTESEAKRENEGE
ncbi:MAG: aminoacyl-tRNA hydrolase [Deltaproteobacteria bacterium]|nr:aminoacyl-tRNA hydrolase [Deltaproteobacteria bacterium]